VYGDVYDRNSKVAQITIKALSNQVIDIQQVSYFDFIFITDAVQTLMDSIHTLQQPTTTPVHTNTIQIVLLCSGMSTSLDTIVTTIVAYTQSHSPLRYSTTTKYSFYGTSNVEQLLTTSRVSILQQIQTYLTSLYKYEYTQLQSLSIPACQEPSFNIQALHNCKVYVTLFNNGDDPTEYWKIHHVMLTATFIHYQRSYFQLQGLTTAYHSVPEPSDAYYEPLFDPISGGYYLTTRRIGSDETYIFNQTFHFSTNEVFNYL
jgi:hypothetical protein